MAKYPNKMATQSLNIRSTKIECILLEAASRQNPIAGTVFP
jgi:hypothetical protein